MTKTENGIFVLEERHLHKGLTSEDVSAYAGIPIVIAAHDDFPHSPELRKSETLSNSKLKERRNAIVAFLKSKCVIDAELEETDEIMFASWKGAFSGQVKIDVKLGNTHYEHVLANRVLQFGKKRSNPNSRELMFTIPGALTGGEGGERWQILPAEIWGDPAWIAANALRMKSCQIVSKGFLFTDPRDETPETLLANITGLPEGRITRVPDLGLARLHTSLHEMRHYVQVICTDPDIADICAFYCERDSEFFPRGVLHSQLPRFGIDPEPYLQEHLLESYASLLGSAHSHAIAPYLELPGTIRGAIDPFSVRMAVDLIRSDLCDAAGYVGPDKKAKHGALQNNLTNHAEQLYPLLRECVKHGQFAHNPLAEHIANRILEGVEYFCDGLTYSPRRFTPALPGRPAPA